MSTYYIVRSLPGHEEDALYLNTKIRLSPMRDYPDSDAPPITFVTHEQALSFAKENSILQVMSVKDKTFASKVAYAKKYSTDKYFAGLVAEHHGIAEDNAAASCENLCAPAEKASLPGIPETLPAKPSMQKCLRGTDQDFADSEYVQKFIRFAGAFSELLTATEYILRVSPSKISDLDHQQNDELEFAEYFSLNAAEGFRCYKRMHEIRQQRRFWKDLREAAELVKPILSKLSESQCQTALKGISSRCVRLYTLRSPQSFAHTDYLFDQKDDSADSGA